MEWFWGQIKKDRRDNLDWWIQNNKENKFIMIIAYDLKAGHQCVLVSFLRRHGGRFDPFSKKNLLRQLKRNRSSTGEKKYF